MNKASPDASKKAFLEAVLTVVTSMTQPRYQYDPCGKSWFEFDIKDEYDAVLDAPELKKALIKIAETTNYQGKGKTNLEGICEVFNIEAIQDQELHGPGKGQQVIHQAHGEGRF